MSDLESLVGELTELETQRDLEGLRRVREQIVVAAPESDAAGEALYKIGLDMLFRQRDLGGAVEKFTAAAALKKPFWSDAARTSLGLCYYHHGRVQKALFELRKVAYVEAAGPHSVTALMFMEHILQNDNQLDEAKRVRKDRINQLEKLVHAAEQNDPAELGFYLHSLGLAYRDQGQDARGAAALERARALGPEGLGAELYQSVLDALG